MLLRTFLDFSKINQREFIIPEALLLCQHFLEFFLFPQNFLTGNYTIFYTFKKRAKEKELWTSE